MVHAVPWGHHRATQFRCTLLTKHLQLALRDIVCVAIVSSCRACIMSSCRACPTGSMTNIRSVLPNMGLYTVLSSVTPKCGPSHGVLLRTAWFPCESDDQMPSDAMQCNTYDMLCPAQFSSWPLNLCMLALCWMLWCCANVNKPDARGISVAGVAVGFNRLVLVIQILALYLACK